MTNKVKKQVEWAVDKLLLQANRSVVLCIICEKGKDEARIYLDGERVATISEEMSSFGWPLTKENIEELYETSKTEKENS